MDVSEIQSWDSGATNSGVAFNAPSNVTAGDDVVMSVFMVGGVLLYGIWWITNRRKAVEAYEAEMERKGNQ